MAVWVTEVDARAIPPEEARAIYHANYWNTVGGKILLGRFNLTAIDVAGDSESRRGVSRPKEWLV